MHHKQGGEVVAVCRYGIREITGRVCVGVQGRALRLAATSRV